jgi:hypothetical protein
MDLPLFAFPEDMQMKMFKANPMDPVSVRADHRVMLYTELAAAWERTTLGALAQTVVPNIAKYAAVQAQSFPTPSDSAPSPAGWRALPAGLARALSDVLDPEMMGWDPSGAAASVGRSAAAAARDSSEELVRHTRAALNALCDLPSSEWKRRYDIDLRIVVAAWSAAADRGTPLDRLLVGWMPPEEVSAVAVGVQTGTTPAIQDALARAKTLARGISQGPWYIRSAKTAGWLALKALRAPFYGAGWLLHQLGLGVLFVAVGLERLGGAPAQDNEDADDDSSSESSSGPRIFVVNLRRPRSDDDE